MTVYMFCDRKSTACTLKRKLQSGYPSTAFISQQEFETAKIEIPDEIEISLAGLDIGDSLHISAVTLPKGAESAITDRDFTIATIVAPSSMKSDAGDAEEDAAEAATDGE